MNKKVICATNRQDINEVVAEFEGFDVVYTAVTTTEALKGLSLTEADILLLTDLIDDESGDLASFIVGVTQDYPNIRIVFITGPLMLEDPERKEFFSTLYTAGVYDVLYGAELDKDMLEDILNNPKTKEGMAFLGRKKGQKSKSSFVFNTKNETISNITKYYDNIYSFSSIKPGTGKSFCSINVATLIAEHGIKNPDTGKNPRVALIEADLQNLSIGTLLGIPGDKNVPNLKTAMDKIAEIIGREEPFETIADPAFIEDAEKFIIEKCFKRISKIPNLYSLVGSELTWEELRSIKEPHYAYLLKLVSENFDVVIIDTNSSFDQVNTFSLLMQSKMCFYIMNLDFNNVRNNVRYLPFLDKIRLRDRIKFVLNQYIPENPPYDYFGLSYETLHFDTGYIEARIGQQFLAKIPALPLTVFLNRSFDNTPLVMGNDDYTLNARYELMKIANTIYPLENFESVGKKIQASKEGIVQKKKGFFKK